MNLKFYQRILVLSSIIFVVFVVWKIEPGCLVQRVFNIPCLTCGMTRALFALFNGDVSLSVRLHPMLWSVPVLSIMFLFYERLFTDRIKIVSVTVLILILSGFLINYLRMF